MDNTFGSNPLIAWLLGCDNDNRRTFDGSSPPRSSPPHRPGCGRGLTYIHSTVFMMCLSSWAHNLVEIAYLHEANGLLERSLNHYSSAKSQDGKWHFIRSEEKVKHNLSGSSKVIGNMLSALPKLPFTAYIYFDRVL